MSALSGARRAGALTDGTIAAALATQPHALARAIASPVSPHMCFLQLTTARGVHSGRAAGGGARTASWAGAGMSRVAGVAHGVRLDGVGGAWARATPVRAVGVLPWHDGSSARWAGAGVGARWQTSEAAGAPEGDAGAADAAVAEGVADLAVGDDDAARGAGAGTAEADMAEVAEVDDGVRRSYQEHFDEWDVHVRATEFGRGDGDDPFLESLAFPLDILQWTSYQHLNYAPHAHPQDKKVKVKVRVRKLAALARPEALSPEATEIVKRMCGPRYKRPSDVLTLTSDQYPTASQNKRRLLELLHAIVTEAVALERELKGEGLLK